MDRFSLQIGQAALNTESRPVKQQSQQAQGASFGQVLQQTMTQQQSQSTAGQGVAFSKHAISRVEERGIEVTPALMEQLADSVERAQAKGATNILAMDSTRAFIINVPNARVITAITQDEMKENIFTNIDGAVFLQK